MSPPDLPQVSLLKVLTVRCKSFIINSSKIYKQLSDWVKRFQVLLSNLRVGGKTINEDTLEPVQRIDGTWSQNRKHFHLHYYNEKFTSTNLLI